MAGYDVIITGSGAGGGTMARALAESGRKVLILERGEDIPREPQNWSAAEVFGKGRYISPETWLDRKRRSFQPQVHYNTGGATRHYGAALWEMEETDFGPVVHQDGISPSWPITYAEMSPYYRLAEEMYHVHGTDHPYPRVEHEPVIAKLAAGLSAAGLHPQYAPAAVMLEEGCTRCSTCDGFPCRVMAKGDAVTCGIMPALATGNVTLITGAEVTSILRTSSGHAAGVIVHDSSGVTEYYADQVVLAAGAVNSAGLWLRSGLPDPSGQAGRNLMLHNSQAVLAIGKERIPPGFFKTLRIMDYYHEGKNGYPLGSVQMAGQPKAAMLRGESALARVAPSFTLREVAERSVVFWLMTEDMPDPANRVTISPDGMTQVSYRRNNTGPARELYREVASLLPSLGYPLHLRKQMPLAAIAHQCGTLRMSQHPLDGVVSPLGESWEVPGLFVCDASVFPSSSAVNPALTIIANALRVADRIIGKESA